MELSKAQKEIARKIADEAERKGIDPKLALAIAWTENRFSSTGVSSAGALGPMQVMPSNAKGLGLKKEDLLDEDKNIEAGIEILKQNLDRFDGNVAHAVAGYNSSWETSGNFAKTNDFSILPKETQQYLKDIDAMHPLDQSGYISEAPDAVFGEVEPMPETKALPKESLESQFNLSEAIKENILQPFGEQAAGAQIGELGGAATGAVAGRKELTAASQAAKAAQDISGTAGQKWSAKTGFGKGEGQTVQEVSEAYKRAKNKGKVSSKILPNESLNINRYAEAQNLAKQAEQEALAKALPSKIAKALGRVPGGSIFAGTAAGMDAAEALKAYEEGNLPRAAIKGIGALGGASSLIPTPPTRLVGGALATAAEPASWISDVLRENKRRKMAGLSPISRGQEEIEYDPMGNPVR